MNTGSVMLVWLICSCFKPRPTRGRMRIHCLENVDKALQFLKEQRVHLENVGSHDIVDGNHRLTLGLLWTIILRFQVRDAWISSDCFGTFWGPHLTIRESSVYWSVISMLSLTSNGLMWSDAVWSVKRWPCLDPVGVFDPCLPFMVPAECVITVCVVPVCLYGRLSIPTLHSVGMQYW